MQTFFRYFAVGLSVAFIPAIASLATGAQKKNNNAAQERKDDARIQAARQDVSEVQKRIQAGLKEIKTAEAEAKQSFEAIASAKKAFDETSNRLERWISQNLGIPEAIEAQKAAQTAYEEATKPHIAAMRTNPKFMPLVERAEKAEKLLKSLATNTELDPAVRQQQQAAAAKEMADLRATVASHLETIPELKYPREKLTAAQTKLTELRAQLKRQLELHPDLKSAEKKWSQAKEASEKGKERLLSLKRKTASEQSKLMSEQAQLAKATMQDRQNDNKNKNNKNNKKKKKN